MSEKLHHAGIYEGDTCLRVYKDGSNEPYICMGKIDWPPVKNCACHINPPCSACVDNQLMCDKCFTVIDEDEESRVLNPYEVLKDVPYVTGEEIGAPERLVTFLVFLFICLSIYIAVFK